MATQEGSPKDATDHEIQAKDLKIRPCQNLLTLDDVDQNISTSVSHQFVAPRTINGPSNHSTVKAIDWSYNGLVAYGSNQTVVVIDTKNMQFVQCLVDKHRSVVNNVLWCQKVSSKEEKKNSVQLVSSDTQGNIIHWDLQTGSSLVSLQDGNKAVLKMEWVPGEANKLLLATLHVPYFFIIWDLQKQTKLWKKGFLDSISYFEFNPFNKSEVAFMSSDCLLFVDDFNPKYIPSSNGRKCYISSSRAAEHEDSSRTRDRFKKLMKEFIVGDSKPRADSAMTVSECLGFKYHRSLRHNLLLHYARDIVIIDLLISQTVGIISTDKSMTPLVQVLPARQRDVLFCLHESGSVSVRVRRKTGSVPILPSPMDGPSQNPIQDVAAGLQGIGDVFSYEHKCQTEVIRPTKGLRVLAIALDPMTEKNIIVLLSSGKTMHLELEVWGNEHHTERNSLCLSDMFKPIIDDKCVVPPLRLITTGILSAIESPITVIRMCPPLTTRNQQHHNPLLAAGTRSGIVQIFNVATGILEKEMAIHNYPVRGIEWSSLDTILTYAHLGQNRKVVNELCVTDVLSGQIVKLREKGMENPIEIIRVSHLRQYFVVVYKDGPFELWNLKTLSLLRTMPKTFPFVSALEWSPVHGSRSSKSSHEGPPKEGEEPAPPTAPSTGVEKAVKEYVVFSDTNSQVFHYAIDGNNLRESNLLPKESVLITSLAIKKNQIVMADVAGYLSIWNMKIGTSRKVNTNRNSIRKIRFSPGKGNFKLLVLYMDGVEVVDLKNDMYEFLGKFKGLGERGKVIDVDWAAPDTPILATEDGCLLVMDSKLTLSTSSLSNYTFKDPVCCPALLPPPAQSLLQLLLSSRTLTPESHVLSVLDGFSLDILPAVNDQLDMMKLEALKYSECGTAARSLVASRLVRDPVSVDFWAICRYYVDVAACNLQREKKNEKIVTEVDSQATTDFKRINEFPQIEPLDTCYDILCDPYFYQRLQLERVNILEGKKGDYRHTQKVVERLILLGETERAIKLLLETDLDNPNYYSDGIKACLIATMQSTGEAQSTIKLVATNLIANGKVWEGVQLLCLIGKGLVGCNYLNSLKMWDSAVWLAKSILPPAETLYVLDKWITHLTDSGEKEAALQVLVSQGQLVKALNFMVAESDIGRAGLLLQALTRINFPVDKTLFADIQEKFHKHTNFSDSLYEFMGKLQPVC